jgi:hypothetical protein
MSAESRPQLQSKMIDAFSTFVRHRPGGNRQDLMIWIYEAGQLKFVTPGRRKNVPVSFEFETQGSQFQGIDL